MAFWIDEFFKISNFYQEKELDARADVVVIFSFRFRTIISVSGFDDAGNPGSVTDALKACRDAEEDERIRNHLQLFCWLGHCKMFFYYPSSHE